tara:strand:+ start:13683 stop:14840 length:1158 start_codon:yes stop_codon:yes gene_type:complete
MSDESDQIAEQKQQGWFKKKWKALRILSSNKIKQLLPKRLVNHFEEKPSRLKLIRTISTIITPSAPIFAAFAGIWMGQEFLKSFTFIFCLILLMALPMLGHFFVSIFSKRIATVLTIGRLSEYIEYFTEIKPTDGWQDWDIAKWDSEFKEFSRLLENSIQFIIGDLSKRNNEAVETSYDIACNLMVKVSGQKAEKDIIKTLNKCSVSNSSGIYDLYEGKDEISREETLYNLLLIGFSEKAEERGHEPCFFKVPNSIDKSLPGAQVLLQRWISRKDKVSEKRIFSQYVPDPKNYSSFRKDVPEKAEERFKEIFQDKEDHFRSFISVLLMWGEGENRKPVGVLNIESKKERFIVDTRTLKLVQYMLSIASPIAGAFAYVFFNNFIEK